MVLEATDFDIHRGRSCCARDKGHEGEEERLTLESVEEGLPLPARDDTDARFCADRAGPDKIHQWSILRGMTAQKLYLVLRWWWIL